MFLLVALILFTRKNDSKKLEASDYKSIDNELTLTPGGDDYVNLKKLGDYYSESSDMLSLYWAIPDISHDESIIFRSKDVYCYAYLGDEMIFSTDAYESKFYIASPGNNWNIFTVPSSHGGEILEIQINYAYGTDAVTADNFYCGDRYKWAMDFLISKIMAILLSAFIIFAGIVIMAMDHSSYKRSGKHSLLYLGIYALLMGVWSLIETNTLQLFETDGRLIQLLDNVLMIMDTIPLFFYLDAEFDIFKHMPLRIIAVIDILYIYFCMLGQLFGFTDLHNHLMGAWIATSLSFLILVWILARQIISFVRGEKIKKSVMIQVIGFLALMVIVVICLPIYAKSDGIDRAESIRFGMLLMIVLFAIAGQLNTFELIRRGTYYEIAKNLAYQDALTGLGNRTAYLEAVEKYQTDSPANLGVVFFDVNDLKTANDKYGHEMGDELISSASQIIQNSFGEIGKAYRTGGDEFVVFIEGDNPKNSYEECLAAFNKSISSLNKSEKYPFLVNIANGFSQRENPGAEELAQMISEADASMYENKKMLKEKTKQ